MTAMPTKPLGRQICELINKYFEIQAPHVKSKRMRKGKRGPEEKEEEDVVVKKEKVRGMEKVKLQLEADGYAKLEGLLSAAECDEIEALFDYWTFEPLKDAALRQRLGKDFGDQSQSQDTPIDQFRLINVNGPAKYDARLCNNVFEQKCRDVVEEILGDEFDVDYSQFLTKLGNQPRSVFPWHQDQQYWPKKFDPATPTTTLTFSLALSDATKEHGCLRVAAKSHLSQKVRPVKEAPDKRAVVMDEPAEEEIVYLPVKRGDVTIHGEWIVHGSGGNCRESPRKTIVMAFRHKDMIRYERDVGYSHSYNDDPKVLQDARNGLI